MPTVMNPPQTSREPIWERLIAFKQTELLEESMPAVWESARPPRWRLPSVAVGLLLVGFIVASAVIIRVRVKDGAIVVKNVPEQGIVSVAGGKITLKLPAQRDAVEITSAPNGRGVNVKNGDTSATGEKVNIETTDGKGISAAFEPELATRPAENETNESRGPDAPKTIDLLKLIKPSVHAIDGEWRLDGGTLVSPFENWARIQIPYAPPDRYTVELIATRIKGAALAIGLVMGGSHQFAVLLEDRGRWYKNGTPRSGLDCLDKICVGFNHHGQNPSNREGPIFRDNESVRIRCVVGTDSILVTRDDEEIIRWSGSPSRLSQRPEWTVPNSNQLYLGALWGVFEIKALTVTPHPTIATAEPSSPDRTLRQPESADLDDSLRRRFAPLFNGKDLTGWKTHPSLPDLWRVERGVLIGPDSGGYLYTERGDYKDFHLRLESRIGEGVNSGVYFRAVRPRQT